MSNVSRTLDYHIIKFSKNYLENFFSNWENNLSKLSKIVNYFKSDTLVFSY